MKVRTLIAFAEARGLMNLSVVEVLERFKTMKKYRRPKTSAVEAEYPKMRLSWTAMQSLLHLIKNRKNAFACLLRDMGVDTKIIIGGSLSLKYQLAQFYERAFYDIDLIIYYKDKEEKTKIMAALNRLVSAGLGKNTSRYYSCCSSYMFGNIMFKGIEHPVNIIVAEKDIKFCSPDGVFNSPWEVFQAKKDFRKKGCNRSKDLIDLYKALA